MMGVVNHELITVSSRYISFRGSVKNTTVMCNSHLDFSKSTKIYMPCLLQVDGDALIMFTEVP